VRAQGRQEVVDADGPGIGIVSTRTIYRANRRSFAGTSSAPWRLSGGPTADARSFRRALKHERRELPPPWRFPHHIASGPTWTRSRQPTTPRPGLPHLEWTTSPSLLGEIRATAGRAMALLVPHSYRNALVRGFAFKCGQAILS